MTTTRALTCRAVAEHSPEPPHDRPALPGTAPTQIPRWTQDCRPDRAQIEVAVPEDLRAAVPPLARDLEVAPGSIWLAAHARVLQALSGEQEITTG